MQFSRLLMHLINLCACLEAPLGQIELSALINILLASLAGGFSKNPGVPPPLSLGAMCIIQASSVS